MADTNIDKSIVSVKNITKVFGKIVALNDISLNINKGEFVSLLGPSGCGKTTFLRIIAGLETQTSGKVYINGCAIDNLPANKRPVNMVFQRYALFPHLNIFDNIAFGLRIIKLPKMIIKEKVFKMLKFFRLEGFEYRKPNELSGGQMQRIALARALITEPVVLLLDEPLGALDLKLRKQMQIELRNIQRELKMTFIYVTHDQEEALTMSDTIVIMNQGKIVQIGDADDIYSNPLSVFAASFIGDINLFKVKVKKVNEKENKLDIEFQNRILSYSVDDFNKFDRNMNLYLYIRPENIRVYNKNQSVKDDFIFEGTLINSIFLGSIIKFQVMIKKDLIVTSQKSIEINDKQKKIGDRILISFSKDNLFLLIR